MSTSPKVDLTGAEIAFRRSITGSIVISKNSLTDLGGVMPVEYVYKGH